VHECQGQGLDTGPASAGDHPRAARALGVSVVLIALYYLAPLDHLTGISLLVSMIIGLLALAAMTAHGRARQKSHPPPVIGAERSSAAANPIPG
jgi:hypothetical protein